MFSGGYAIISALADVPRPQPFLSLTSCDIERSGFLRLSPMPGKKPLLRILREVLPLTAVAIATVMVLVMPASAQFFPFFSNRPPPPPQQQRGNDLFFSPFGPPQQAPRPVDNWRAPAPLKRDTVPEQEVMVMGDAMADWLASGLEEAFAERPELGVVRKGKHLSGLIRYQAPARGEPVIDWAAAAKGMLANENPAAIVIMLGLNDRVAIRETAERTDTKNAPAKNVKGGNASKGGAPGTEVKPDDAELPADDEDTPSIIANERNNRSANGSNEFRSDRWVELYIKKIDDMITVAKSKGVPVLWVGLPAVRGQRAMSDTLFLDTLYRDAAGRAGITYVDVWDGFVDDAGRFLPRGPDFEGQPRTLRSADGVYFTKPGARKLAHYVDREIQRLLSTRSVSLSLPTEPVPDADAKPSGPAPRPLVGPVVPLVASSVGTDELLGGPGTRPPAVDALAAKTMVKGEALDAPAGRADDFSWPRREVGRVELGKETPIVASVSTSDNTGQRAKQQPQQRPRTVPAQQRQVEVQVQGGGFFGFGAPQQPPPQRPQQRGGPPRPPAPVQGLFPGFFR
jgi:uncharacterized protein